MKLTLHHRELSCLKRGRIGRVTINARPHTVTVCGYTVRSSSLMWKWLTWDRVQIDGDSRKATFFGRGQYLHVSTNQDGAVYRVRCRLEIGDLVDVKGFGKARVVSVQVGGVDNGVWWWSVRLSGRLGSSGAGKGEE